MDIGTFLTKAFSVVSDFGTLSPHLKLAAVLTISISAWKVSAFQPLWKKLGSWQVIVSPALSVILGIVNALFSTGTISLNVIMNALVVGFGSVAFHEFMDALKTIPGIAPFWQNVINFISGLLGGSAQQQIDKK